MVLIFWMRHRNECGSIIGEDVAVPKYLPIDESHPSINSYKGLYEWGGSGMAKVFISRRIWRGKI